MQEAMKLRRFAWMAASALGLATVGGLAAHADPITVAIPATDAFSQHGDFTPPPNQIGPQAADHIRQWDAKTGRWGVRLDVSQPTDRDVRWRDARVGAYYRLTPS